jgi:hypothetical protein
MCVRGKMWYVWYVWYGMGGMIAKCMLVDGERNVHALFVVREKAS